MKNVVVVGSQWGDEGKGKIVDWLSNEADVVVVFKADITRENSCNRYKFLNSVITVGNSKEWKNFCTWKRCSYRPLGTSK